MDDRGRANGQLTAVGVDKTGAITRVPTDAFREFFADSMVPKPGSGSLWFTGADVACKDDAELLVVHGGPEPQTSTTTETGIRILGDAASSVVKVGDSVVVAGLGPGGVLSFAHASDPVDSTDTDVLPFLASQQTRYLVISDKNGGAWAQGVNGHGNLVVAHVGGRRWPRSRWAPGRSPATCAWGPDQSLWTQGKHQGKLVIGKVGMDGTVTKYATGVEPPRFVAEREPRPDPGARRLSRPDERDFGIA